MDTKKIKEYFYNAIEEHKDLSVGVAAIKTLNEVMIRDNANTVQGLKENLQRAVVVMKDSNYSGAVINSGCELFRRYVTYTKLDTSNFAECKKVMMHRGQIYVKKISKSRGKIVEFGSNFIASKSKILTHSRSRIVLQTLTAAAKQGKKFEVFVTTSAPSNRGKLMCESLQAEGIPCTLIADLAVGSIMEQIDFVMVGAEGVLESGGIVNQLGSYTIAICAKAAKKPFYVLTESFKFTRLFPLHQRDLPEEYRFALESRGKKDDNNVTPSADYTPPSYITLLFTDLGIFGPSLVSDKLINLYL